MRIIKIDRKENFFEAVPDSTEDLWYLERIIQTGDLVSGKSERKIKAREEGEKTLKENIFVEIEVEKAELHEASGMLRMNGIIVSGHPLEFVELKAHHSLEIMPGKKIKVKKKQLKEYEIEKLEKAKKASGREKTLIVVMDDEEAEIAFLKDSGFEGKARILAKKEGKRFKSDYKKEDYFKEVLEKISALDAKQIVVAGPGFSANEFLEYAKKNGFQKNVFQESTNSVGTTGLNELAKSGKLEKIVSESMLLDESRAVERILKEIGKNSGLAEYGFNEVKKAAETGAVKELILSEEKLLHEREKIEEIMEKAEHGRAKIIVVSGNHEAGKKIKGLGGIAAILRFRI
jgi:protein pelota